MCQRPNHVQANQSLWERNLPLASDRINERDNESAGHAMPRLAKFKVTSHAIPHAAFTTRVCIYRDMLEGNRASEKISTFFTRLKQKMQRMGGQDMMFRGSVIWH
jgi:hypothetical protein